jgi:hypothetical protein
MPFVLNGISTRTRFSEGLKGGIETRHPILGRLPEGAIRMATQPFIERRGRRSM